MSQNQVSQPNDLDESPPADQKLPLDAWHRAKGARMVSFAGYEMPIQYEGIMAEHLWTRTHAGLFDVSHMGQVTFTGKDADAELEKILPGEIRKLGLNRIRYSLLLAEDGGILDDLMVTRRENDIYTIVNGATKYDDLAYIVENMSDSVTINLMDEHALLALQGPKAGAVLASLIPAVDELYFMMAGAFEHEGMKLWISRSGYTGEDGFEISVDGDKAEKLANMLCAHDDVKPIGLGARDSLRLEAGLPLYGHDLSPEITPMQANLGFALSKRRREEGGFAGAERVLSEYPEGAAMKRVGLNVEGRQPVREGALIIDENGNEIGQVTSGGFAPSLERPIAMAYVPGELSDEGTKLTAEQRAKPFVVTVTSMPFVPHNYRRKPKA